MKYIMYNQLVSREPNLVEYIIFDTDKKIKTKLILSIEKAKQLNLTFISPMEALRNEYYNYKETN